MQKNWIHWLYDFFIFAYAFYLPSVSHCLRLFSAFFIFFLQSNVWNWNMLCVSRNVLLLMSYLLPEQFFRLFAFQWRILKMLFVCLLIGIEQIWVQLQSYHLKLFFCSIIGNICRSPIAEACFKQILEEKGIAQDVRLSHSAVSFVCGQASFNYVCGERMELSWDDLIFSFAVHVDVISDVHGIY